MGWRMKEIQQVEFYDCKTMEEIDYDADEFDQEEEEVAADQINVIKKCLSFLLSAEESSKSTGQREEAFATIMKALEEGSPFYNNKIVENCIDFDSLFHQCLISIENSSSSREVSLASYILGFLALSTEHLVHDVAYTILHKSLRLIYKRLKLPFVIDSTKTVSLLNCLAIIHILVGFGVSNIQEEEDLQQPVIVSDVIWQKVTKILGEAKGQALLAYGFSLTSRNRPATIDDSKFSYLLSVLDDRGETSRVGAICAQILALIHEIYDLPNDLREKVLHMVNYRLAVAENKSQWNVFKKVAEFLEEPISKKNDIGRKDVRTSSWADLIRLKFLKQFLGNKGFSEHIQKNDFIRAVLKVSCTSDDEAAETSGSEKKRNHNNIRMGKKPVQRKRLRVVNKRRILNKERSQSLEKARMMKSATVGWML